jgi:hypothetical protein
VSEDQGTKDVCLTPLKRFCAMSSYSTPLQQLMSASTESGFPLTIPVE